MNIILYRAKSHSGEWIYGLPVYLSASALGQSKPDGIQDERSLELVAIVPETLGAFINDFDMHHNRLFEGDHVRSYRAVYDYREGGSDDPLGYETECYDTVMLRHNRYWLKGESFGYDREDLKDASNFILVGNEFDGDGAQYDGESCAVNDTKVDGFDYCYCIELTLDEYNALRAPYLERFEDAASLGFEIGRASCRERV